MAYEDIQDLFDLVDARLADNKTRNITPAKHREVLYAIINQWKDCVCLKSFDLTIDSADILTSNSTPIEVIAAPGTGKFLSIETCQSSVFGGTTAYDTNIGGSVSYENYSTFTISSLNLSAIAIYPMNEASFADDFSDLENRPIQFTTLNGDPLNGDRRVRIWGTYRILEI